MRPALIHVVPIPVHVWQVSLEMGHIVKVGKKQIQITLNSICSFQYHIMFALTRLGNRFRAGFDFSLYCTFLEINECLQPGACPENAICNDLIGRCEYTCKPGFEGLACSGK
jgi:hypothetical protein